MTRTLAFQRSTVAAVLLTATSCVGQLPDDEIETRSGAVTVPGKGTATTLDLASWNIEWFGDTANGPTNEPLQLQNVHDVVAGTDFDIWGFAEVVSSSQWNSLESQLPGYTGFVANEAVVQDGATYYSDFGNLEQKVGILYKSSVATLISARIILGANNDDFAGRPPMEVKLHVTLNGASDDIVVIVQHPKCCSDTASWQRRVNASNALKAYLDATYPTQKVWVIGDFNDDVDTSIATGHASPYANFVNDSARYKFPTKALSDAGVASTVDFPDMIDHHLNTNETNATYVAGSAEVYRVDQFVPSYGTTTSDHYPVLTRYNWSGAGGAGGGGGTGGAAQVIINEILANEPGSDTAGEAVELVNIGGTAASIGGWTLSDSIQTRHTFAAGTTLAAGKAIVVFGGASGIPGGLTNAVAASTGALGLNNTGDTVTLRDASSATKDGFTYGSSLSGTDGVSMNRSPDGTTGGFVLHTALSSLQRSPGTRANGTPW